MSGLRAAVLRRSEKTRSSSSSADEVGGLRAQSRERSEQSNTEWIDGGLTNLNNLTLVCAHHHHNFLARGWTCRINTDGIPEWTPPTWVDQEQKPMINTRIQAVLTARKRAQRNKPIIS